MIVPEQLTVNGLDLLSRVRGSRQLSALLATPAKRTPDVEVPGRHGRMRTPRKRYDAHEFTLPLIVEGRENDGSIPGDRDTRAAFQRRVDELVATFAAEQVELIHTRSDGTARRLWAEVIARVEPDRYNPGDLGQLGYKLSAVDPPFWTDLGDVTTSATSAGAAATWAAAEFGGATAPMDDLVVRFEATAGEVPNPRLAQGPASVTYRATLPEGAWVELDCASWEIRAAGADVDYTAPAKTGGLPRYFELAPGPDPLTPPELSVSHTGTGTLTATLTGRRRFLVG